MTKFALFGAGFIGRVHANNIAAHPRAELRYIYDINSEAAEQLASRLGAKVASSSEEIWAANDVDAVLIASSTNTHADLLSGAIQAHKPAYCEKPIDLNMERVKAVVQEAHHTNIPIMIGFSRRFDSNHLGVREATLATVLSTRAIGVVDYGAGDDTVPLLCQEVVAGTHARIGDHDAGPRPRRTGVNEAGGFRVVDVVRAGKESAEAVGTVRLRDGSRRSSSRKR